MFTKVICVAVKKSYQKILVIEVRPLDYGYGKEKRLCGCGECYLVGKMVPSGVILHIDKTCY